MNNQLNTNQQYSEYQPLISPSNQSLKRSSSENRQMRPPTPTQNNNLQKSQQQQQSYEMQQYYKQRAINQSMNQDPHQGSIQNPSFQPVLQTSSKSPLKNSKVQQSQYQPIGMQQSQNPAPLSYQPLGLNQSPQPIGQSQNISQNLPSNMQNFAPQYQQNSPPQQNMQNFAPQYQQNSPPQQNMQNLQYQHQMQGSKISGDNSPRQGAFHQFPPEQTGQRMVQQSGIPPNQQHAQFRNSQERPINPDMRGLSMSGSKRLDSQQGRSMTPNQVPNFSQRSPSPNEKRGSNSQLNSSKQNAAQKYYQQQVLQSPNLNSNRQSTNDQFRNQQNSTPYTNEGSQQRVSPSQGAEQMRYNEQGDMLPVASQSYFAPKNQPFNPVYQTPDQLDDNDAPQNNFYEEDYQQENEQNPQLQGLPIYNSKSKFVQQEFQPSNSPIPGQKPIVVLPGEAYPKSAGTVFGSYHPTQNLINSSPPIDVQTYVLHNEMNRIEMDPRQSNLYGEPDEKIITSIQNNYMMGNNQAVGKLAELDSPKALPKRVLPSFNNDINDYNQNQEASIQQFSGGKQPKNRLSLIDRNRTFNLEDFYNNPKIMLITLSRLYKVDLFKETQLFRQLQELEKQGIQLTTNQKKLVAREEHIYNILSQRRMEYLEYMDLLIPYLVLFYRQIKGQILEQNSKINKTIYRGILQRARAEQEQYLLMKHGDDSQWNIDLFNETQKKKVFQDSMFGLLVFPNIQSQQKQPLSVQFSKDVINELTSQKNQQVLRLKQSNVIIEKWCALYSFNLFAFRNAGDSTIDHQIKLPLHFNAIENEKNPESFLLRSEDNMDQIEIMFDRDVRTMDWYMELLKQICYKQYLFILGRNTGFPDPKIINFFLGIEIEKLDFSLDTQEGDFSDQETFFPPESGYFREIVVMFLVNFFFSLKFCSSLKIFKVSGQRFPEFLMNSIISELSHPTAKCQIEVLILDGNDVDLSFLQNLDRYLSSANGENIVELSMSNIKLGDTGVQMVSESLVRRHTFLRTRGTQGKQLPLARFSLSNVLMSDLGLFHVCQMLDKVNQANSWKGEEVEYRSKLSLDVSQNDLTENSLRHLGGVMSKFNGIVYLNLSKSYRMNALYSEYFFDSLLVNRENYSLEVLDLSCIKINEKFFEGILKFLASTCTLQAMIISYNEDFDQYLANYHNKSLLRLLRIQQGAQNSEAYVFSDLSENL